MTASNSGRSVRSSATGSDRIAIAGIAVTGGIAAIAAIAAAGTGVTGATAMAASIAATAGATVPVGIAGARIVATVHRVQVHSRTRHTASEAMPKARTPVPPSSPCRPRQTVPMGNVSAHQPGEYGMPCRNPRTVMTVAHTISGTPQLSITIP